MKAQRLVEEVWRLSAHLDRQDIEAHIHAFFEHCPIEQLGMVRHEVEVADADFRAGSTFNGAPLERCNRYEMLYDYLKARRAGLSN